MSRHIRTVPDYETKFMTSDGFGHHVQIQTRFISTDDAFDLDRAHCEIIMIQDYDEIIDTQFPLQNQGESEDEFYDRVMKLREAWITALGRFKGLRYIDRKPVYLQRYLIQAEIKFYNELYDAGAP